MKIAGFLYLVLFAILLLVSGQVFAASATAQKVVITPASFSDREGMLIVAQRQGFFRSTTSIRNSC